MFWILATALLGLTCLSLLAALGRSTSVSSQHDRIFYEGQLLEIERQRGLKLIGDAEAGAARTEAARRLLSVSGEQKVQLAHSDLSSRKLAALAVLVFVPLISMPIYLTRGSPAMPSFLLANRPPQVTSAQVTSAQVMSAQVMSAQATPEEKSLNVISAIQQIEAHLAKNPDDGRGHEVIAPVYARTGRFADAVMAYGAALRLLGPSAARHGNLGEAMAFASNGIVTPEARAAFESALVLDSKHIKARFFLALAAQQDGDVTKAVALLSLLRNDIPDGDLKTEITNQLRTMGEVPKGGEVIAALPQDEQAQAIRSMVDGLAQRLASTGGPVEEWARLIRALTILKETDRAGMILEEARKKFAANSEHALMIENAAKLLP